MVKFFPIHYAAYQKWLDQMIEYAEVEDEDLTVAEERLTVEEDTQIYGKIPSLPEDLNVIITPLSNFYTILPEKLREQLFNKQFGSIFPIVGPEEVKFIGTAGEDMTTACIPRSIFVRADEMFFGTYQKSDYTGIRLKSEKYPFRADNHYYFETLISESNILYRTTSTFETLSVDENGVVFKIPGTPEILMTTRDDGFSELRLKDLPGISIHGQILRIELSLADTPIGKIPHFIFKFQECFIMDEEYEDIEIPSFFLYSWKPISELDLYRVAGNLALEQIETEHRALGYQKTENEDAE